MYLKSHLKILVLSHCSKKISAILIRIINTLYQNKGIGYDYQILMIHLQISGSVFSLSNGVRSDLRNSALHSIYPFKESFINSKACI